MNYSVDYIQEMKSIPFDFTIFNNKVICLSGASGLIGSFLIDALLINDIQVKIIALTRNIEQIKARFSKYCCDDRITFLKCDLNEKIDIDGSIDYILHLASLTDPVNYSLYPVETMTVNFFGLKNMLDLAHEKNAKFLFTSSCEVYGINEKLNIVENDYGYIDILNPRACYNEVKQACETLCSSYVKEYGLDIVIPRLSRVYGPTMKLKDSKALSQFIVKALSKEDIVLKSKGEQLFNYTYVGDVVVCLCLLLANKTEHLAYNVSNNELIKLRDIAQHIADYCGTKVVFELPNEIEKTGYSKSMNSVLDCSLFLNEFDYLPDTKIMDGVQKTIDILKSMNE